MDAQIEDIQVRLTDLGLDSLVARGDGAFLVIEHNVSAALACTSGVLWRKQNIYHC